MKQCFLFRLETVLKKNVWLRKNEFCTFWTLSIYKLYHKMEEDSFTPIFHKISIRTLMWDITQNSQDRDPSLEIVQNQGVTTDRIVMQDPGVMVNNGEI